MAAERLRSSVPFAHQFRDFVAGHHVRLPAGDGVAVFRYIRISSSLSSLLASLALPHLFINYTVCRYRDLEGGYFVGTSPMGVALARWWVKVSVTGVW